MHAGFQIFSGGMLGWEYLLQGGVISWIGRPRIVIRWQRSRWSAAWTPDVATKITITITITMNLIRDGQTPSTSYRKKRK